MRGNKDASSVRHPLPYPPPKTGEGDGNAVCPSPDFGGGWEGVPRNDFIQSNLALS